MTSIILSRRRSSPAAYSEQGGDGPGPLRGRRRALLRLRGARPRLRRFISLVDASARAHGARSDAEIARMARELRAAIPHGEISEVHAARAFALVRAAAGRTLGTCHRETQLAGGWALLRGMAVEMETGEGKTLAATLAASAAALAGLRVHVITANDYLARRDEEWMRPVYAALGLGTGVVLETTDPSLRGAAYEADIVYLTAKQAAFDYLRDRITLGRPATSLHLGIERIAGGPCRFDRLILRGLEVAIIDELDSVLIDEARTPLLISRSTTGDGDEAAYRRALEVSEALAAGKDYVVRHVERTIGLTPSGKRRVDDLAAPLEAHGGLWRSGAMRREAVLQALAARILFRRDREYTVRDGKVLVIDDSTGRTLPDRSWRQGLHQAIQLKEGCPLTPRDEPIARLSFQRFFRKYLHLSGMTGTAREAAGELSSIYGLAVLRVPPHRPSRRICGGTRVFRTAPDKERAIVDRVRELHAAGRPVLIGTRRVESSERLSRLFRDAGLPHRVLNARQDREEAEIIRRAGEPGSITVATGMAGRGTDIKLHPGVVEKGGLHVIASEPNESSRADRQLSGRAARQGDPGSHEAFVSLDDEIIRGGAAAWVRLAGRLAPGLRGAMLDRVGERLVRSAQGAAERRDRRLRRTLLGLEEDLEAALAFAEECSSAALDPCRTVRAGGARGTGGIHLERKE